MSQSRGALLMPSIVAALVLVASCASTGTPPASRPTPPAYPPHPELYHLDATPSTVAWGYYDAAAKPVLRVRSGDEVEVSTLITSSPERLAGAGVSDSAVQQSLRDIFREVKDKGPGGHILTGPIYVYGADSGDVLEVRIEKIDLAIPYAYNAFGPRSGFLQGDSDLAHAAMKIIPLDATRMVAHFAPGIDIALHPFFGSMGVAPPAAMGRVSSAPPGIFAGNLDDRYLVAGTTLYIPVWTKGALFEIGDGHAGQGNGEVDITALETSLRGRIRLIARKDMHLQWPIAETPTHWITMGMDRDLTTATKIAIRQAIAFLMTRGLSRDEAYMLTSVACDVDDAELVDGNVGVVVRIPKAVLPRSGSGVD